MSYRTTIVLTAILVILVGAVYFFEARSSGQAETPTADQPIPLVQLPAAEINHVELKAGKDSITLFRAENGGQWKLGTAQSATPENGEEADQDRVNTVVSSLSSLNATRVVTEQASDLSQYGLTQPAAVVTLQTTSGQDEVVRFGGANPSGSGRYVQFNNDPKVYLVYSYLFDDIARMVQDPPRPRPTPTVAPPLQTPAGGATAPAASPTPTP